MGCEGGKVLENLLERFPLVLPDIKPLDLDKAVEPGPDFRLPNPEFVAVDISPANAVSHE